jgi:DNA polymerase-4
MGKTRQVIHLDLDAFYCAVEEQRNPDLKGKPFAVGGRPDQRGVVSSCSYAARVKGVRSAMPMAQALRLCPHLQIVSPHFSEYRRASKSVMERLRKITPLVEQISIDEAFLEVTDLPDPAQRIARRLQEGIRQSLGLPNSLGIAANKLVAKIATDVGKSNAKGGSPPNALTVVPPGGEAEFLAPLPVKMLWGVGPKTAEKLAEIGVQTTGELAAIPEIELMHRFGKTGYELAQRARGIDNRPIEIFHEAKSISQEITYARDVRDGKKLLQTLRSQSMTIAQQLQKQHLTARTVKIKLRWPDFTTLTRQFTLPQPTDESEVIVKTAIALFEKEWGQGRAVRLLGVGVSGVDTPPRQIGLWDENWQKEERLRQAVQDLKDRFGEDILAQGLPGEENKS